MIQQIILKQKWKKLLKKGVKRYMDIQDLVRERIIGNIKIGTRGENGLPKW